MKDRLKEIRKRSKLKQEPFAESIGLTRNFISLLENGDRVPSDRTIKDICRIYNVNETWLRTGEGDMFAPTSREQELAEISASIFKAADNDFKAKLIKYISKMDPEQIALLEKIINDLATNGPKI